MFEPVSVSQSPNPELQKKSPKPLIEFAIAFGRGNVHGTAAHDVALEDAFDQPGGWGHEHDARCSAGSEAVKR